MWGCLLGLVNNSISHLQLEFTAENDFFLFSDNNDDGTQLKMNVQFKDGGMALLKPKR